MKAIVITSLMHLEFEKKIKPRIFINKDIDFQNFDAIFPTTVDKNYKIGFEERYGRNPLLGEFGCFLSHRAIWNTFKDVDAVLVLEDDALCDKGFNVTDVIGVCANDAAPVIIRLGASKVLEKEQWLYYLLKPGFPVKLLSKRVLVNDLFLNTDGTVGYVINSAAMRLLSKNSCRSEFAMLADDWRLMRKLGIAVKSIRPFVVFEDQTRISYIDDFKLRKSGISYDAKLIFKVIIFLPIAFPLVIFIFMNKSLRVGGFGKK